MQTLYEKRYDFVLQERGMESVVKTVGMLTSHNSYFVNADVALFIIMKIHNEKIKVNIHAKWFKINNTVQFELILKIEMVT